MKKLNIQIPVESIDTLKEFASAKELSMKEFLEFLYSC